MNYFFLVNCIVAIILAYQVDQIYNAVNQQFEEMEYKVDGKIPRLHSTWISVLFCFIPFINIFCLFFIFNQYQNTETIAHLTRDFIADFEKNTK